jgi:beta-glucanase (GH16 family)
MIRSKHIITFVNPTYIEFRAKFSDVSGMHPGGWVAGEPRADGSLSWPPEIDIAEFLNDGTIPPVIHMGLQTNGVPWDGVSPPFAASYTDNSNNPATGWPGNSFDVMSFFRPPFNANDAFHTYGLLYEPGAPSVFTIAIDGKMVLTGTYDWMGADSLPIFANLLFTTEVGGNGVGAIDDSKLPTAAVELQYARVYEKISTTGQDFYQQVGR